MNLITFLSFSIYVVWKIKTLEKNALPLKKRKREKDRKGEKNHERIKYTKFCFFFFLQTLILIHTTYTIVNKLSLDKPPHPFDAKSIPFT